MAVEDTTATWGVAQVLIAWDVVAGVVERKRFVVQVPAS